MAGKMDREYVGNKLVKQFREIGCEKASYSSGGKSGFIFFTDKSVCGDSCYDDKQEIFVTILTNKKASELLINVEK